jgi:hypothetical protein
MERMETIVSCSFFAIFFKEALTEKLTVAIPEAQEVSKVSGKA